MRYGEGVLTTMAVDELDKQVDHYKRGLITTDEIIHAISKAHDDLSALNIVEMTLYEVRHELGITQQQDN